MQWYARYPGDYARDTGHLTMLEHGAYTLLMDYYYSTGEALPAYADANAPTLALTKNSRLYRICRAVTQEEQAAVDSVIEHFFTLRGGRYHHARIDQELEKRGEISQKRSDANAAMRAKKTAKASTKRQQVRQQMHQHVHSTTTATSLDTNVSKEFRDLPSSLLMPDGRFLSADQFCQEMWQAYPSVGRRKGHMGKFTEQIKKALKAGEKHETIIAGITAYANYCHTTGQLNKDAERWARDAEWRSDYQVGSPAHRPQQGGQSRQGSGGLAQVIDAGEKAKEMLRRADEA